MTAPFVSNLRSRPGTLAIGDVGAGAITVRVQMPEVWDTIRVAAAPGTTVIALKVAALGALYPEATAPEPFVMKLNGFEVLDENASLAETGAVDGSIFLVTHRRRRPVR